MTAVKRQRLDSLLVERGLYATRARAGDAIRRGTVTVRGEIVAKAGAWVDPTAEVGVADPARGYVSRAALKLRHALDAFAIDPRGAIALDLGASTGGFTQVLLERGARRVHAVDVGHGHLDPGLRGDRRVVALDGVNARDLTPAELPEAPDLVVCDVSFVSLKLALPRALALARPGARLIALVKPQFEVGPQGIGKGGIVRDRALIEAVAADLRRWLERDMNWEVLGVVSSPIRGGDGNRELLIAAAKP
jgi:23S rRNA (cytidine1920-2'-O)/16S rRNA (cytidine1409-2'-O)-methyltransferase